ncbi:HtrA protease/chaperone protein [Sandaracinus amylolyticus]|uniref:HtrA protease/chaperone protein n=1 Tax=Sandaracinus amylolyticus TaxID=927083 RepID=A0A0F6W7L8_9BACT|nr:HtrA protease/chaperone protein [Sandaracinus amylolyticus]
MVAIVAGCAAFVLVGAHVIALAGGSVVAPAAAVAAALVACVVLPVVVGWKVAGGEAKRSVVPGAVAALNVAWLALLIGLAPGASRAVIAAHGDWFLAGHEVAAIRRAMRALAPVVEREAPHLPEIAAAPAPDDAPRVEEPVAEDRAWSARELFERRADAVVTIHAHRPVDDEDELADVLRRLGLDAQTVTGSGFVVGAGGVIVTNHHVLGDATSARVTMRDGRTFDRVRVLATDPSNDLALLAIDAEGLAAVPLAADEDVQIGATTFAIGSPLGLDHTLTQGIVSAIRDESGTTMVQTQAPIAPGSSGGPLFDDRGRLIGVNTLLRGGGLGFAVHVRYVRALLEATRAERALSPFVEGVHVARSEVEGALRPLTRTALEQAGVSVARVAGDCIATWPEATPVVTVRVTGRGHRDVTITADQGDEVDGCLRDRADVPARVAAMQLRGDGADAVSVTLHVEGLGATGTDPGHALDVRIARPAP